MAPPRPSALIHFVEQRPERCPPIGLMHPPLMTCRLTAAGTTQATTHSLRDGAARILHLFSSTGIRGCHSRRVVQNQFYHQSIQHVIQGIFAFHRNHRRWGQSSQHLQLLGTAMRKRSAVTSAKESAPCFST